MACFLGLGECSKSSTSIGRNIADNIGVSDIFNSNITVKNQNNINQISYQNATITTDAEKCCTIDGKNICGPEGTKQLQTYLDKACAGGRGISQQSGQQGKIISSVDENTYQNIINGSNGITQKINDLIDSSVNEDNKAALAAALNMSDDVKSIKTTIKDSINTSIKKNLNVSIINQVLVTTYSNQNATLNICAPISGSCVIDQQSFQDVQIKNITQAFIGVFDNAPAIKQISEYLNKHYPPGPSGGNNGGSSGSSTEPIWKNSRFLMIAGILVGIIVLLIVLLIIAIIVKKSGHKKNIPPINQSPYVPSPYIPRYT